MAVLCLECTKLGVPCPDCAPGEKILCIGGPMHGKLVKRQPGVVYRCTMRTALPSPCPITDALFGTPMLYQERQFDYQLIEVKSPKAKAKFFVYVLASPA